MSKPGDIGTWNGIAEIVFMIAGAVTLYAAAMRAHSATSWRTASASRRVFRALVFGAAHFKYAEFTATMVPTWLPPSQIFWTYATGVGHLRRGVVAAERHQGATRRDAARGDDGAVRAAGARATRDSARRASTWSGSC